MNQSPTVSPVSLCVIVRDDPLLAQALQSARPYVDEIVVVVTSKDLPNDLTLQALDRFANRWELFPACLDEAGDMADFGAARRRSFEIAAHDWCLWMDSDDTIRGLEHLSSELDWAEYSRRSGQNLEMAYPYEYAYTDQGKPYSVQWRGRLVHRSFARWEFPIHETFGPVGSGYSTVLRRAPIVWEHRRPGRMGIASLARNLRILDRWLEKSPDDPRALFYGGKDATMAGQIEKGYPRLERFLAVTEQWDQDPVWIGDRCQAFFHLAETSYFRGQIDQAISWCHRVLEYPTLRDQAYYCLCKYHYFRAQRSGKRKDWESAVYYGRLCLSTESDPDCMTHSDPTNKSINIHEFLSVSLWNVGQIDEALAEADQFLAQVPGHSNMEFNRRNLVALVARRDIARATAKLVEIGEIVDTSTKTAIDSNSIVKRLSPRKSGRSILIAMGDCLETVNPAVLGEKFLGGSETAVIWMARLLAKRGWDVTVATSCGEEKDYAWADSPSALPVRFVQTSRLAGGFEGQFDIFVAWRSAFHFDLDVAAQARVRVLWVHDVWAHTSKENIAKSDVIFCLSQWHKSFFVGHYQKEFGVDLADRVIVTANGIDLTRFESKDGLRDDRKVIYSSSPDRALERLLGLWPKIIAVVPNATLHVFYGFANWLKCARSDEDRQAIGRLTEKLNTTPNVVHYGEVDQKTLAQQMLSAGVMLYPTWFTETFGITFAEAQAAGLKVVASAIGALPETVGENGILLNEPYSDEAFVGAAISALTDTSPEWRKKTIDKAKRFSWDRVADSWNGAFEIFLSSGPRALLDCRRGVAGVGSGLSAEMAELMAAKEAEVKGHMRKADEAERRAFEPFIRRRKKTLHCILTAYGAGNDPIDPEGFPANESRGGGSREGFMGLVGALGRMGDYEVTAWSNFGAKDGYRQDGVTYRQDTAEGRAEKRDFCLAYYDTTPLVGMPLETFKIGMHHTYLPPGDWGIFDWIDLNTAPSEHAADRLRECFDPHGAWAVVPNGLWPRRIPRNPRRGRVIYHTSPDRGLHRLLPMWPSIRSAVPHATLHVVGDVEGYIHGYYTKPEIGRSVRGKMCATVGAAVERLSKDGSVKFLGKLPRHRLDEELGEAEVFAYPCDPSAPCETFSISIMECLRIGLPVVLAPADALESLYCPDGRYMTLNGNDGDDLEDFSKTLISTLRDGTDHWADGRAREWATSFTFERQAKTLVEVIAQAGATIR